MSTIAFVMTIQGMTCASCVSHVERDLKMADGVTVARVRKASERATVEFAPNGAGLAPLVLAVRDAGYDVPADKVNLSISSVLVITNSLRLRGFRPVTTV